MIFEMLVCCVVFVFEDTVERFTRTKQWTRTDGVGQKVQTLFLDRTEGCVLSKNIDRGQSKLSQTLAGKCFLMFFVPNQSRLLGNSSGCLLNSCRAPASRILILDSRLKSLIALLTRRMRSALKNKFMSQQYHQHPLQMTSAFFVTDMSF